LREEKYFYKMIIKKDDFNASDGWLDKLSYDVSAVHPLVRKFQERIEELGLGP
jgi:hypothetical protein